MPRMNAFRSFRVWLLLAGLGFSSASADTPSPVKILLVGDSTTIGSLPRQVNPAGPHLEDMIELLAIAENLPLLEVINTGKGGETAQRLLASGHYDRAIASVSDVDVIFVRLGINDWFKCENFPVDFPRQLTAVVDRLRVDHPRAQIILSTICRFMSDPDCVEVNFQIKKVAQAEGLELFDLYTPFNQFLTDNGPHSLNVRQPPLSSIPEGFHEFLKPYTFFRKGWNGRPDQDVVRVNDISLDPLFGHIEGWYADRHPNTTGYNLIAVETIKFLSSRLPRR